MKNIDPGAQKERMASKYALYLTLVATGSILNVSAQKTQQPNVILIVTDDQGYGDFGFTGNHHVKTPVIDKLAAESVRFTNFYVSPVSAPTRSSLMTGRYSLRTGIRDTYNGGAIMASSEVTIAEVLKKAGYTTGHFGKWHLGDNYPGRPIDQGFDESVMHLGGGMGQPGDLTTYFRYDSSYFDPVLWHNGKQESFNGYCSDIFADQAIGFINKNKNRSFFCYLAFNAPHTPLQVPEKYYTMYKNIDPSTEFEGADKPVMSEKDKEDARKVYAMVTNIDDNIGKLLSKLNELGIAENTIIIFLTDNGPQQRRYLAGMKGLKGTVYNGGVRVPMMIRFEPLTSKHNDINAISAHIDLFPTIAELCKIDINDGIVRDGISLVPQIKGKVNPGKDRELFFYWSRHNPEKYYNMALMRNNFKLVGLTDYDASLSEFELYNLDNDPTESKNIVSEMPEVAGSLKKALDNKLKELLVSKNLSEPPRTEVGSEYENPVILNRNDADGERGIWEQEEIFGSWRVKIHEGNYDIKVRFIKPVPSNGVMRIETGNVINRKKIQGEISNLVELKNVWLPGTDCHLIPFYEVQGRRIFPFSVEFNKTGNRNN